MIKDSYDVIVAGGGPGGSSVAKHLAKLGHSVLMLEKRQEIGAPKRCGEGLSVNTAGIIGKIPPWCIAQKINAAKVYSPDRSYVLMDFGGDSKGYVVERKALDKWLAFEASRAGARVMAKSEVTGVLKDGNSVTGVRATILGGGEVEIRSKVLVAADGVESTVARKAGLNTANKLVNLDSGFQYEMSSLNMEDDKKIILYFGNEIAPRGYIWIFPKGHDVANVGIGTAMAEKPPKHYLDAFIEDNPDIFGSASIIEVNSGGIPVGGFLDNMVLDGFAVVGDAAHQVNPIHGGGLKEATIAGEIAAKVISKCIKNGDVSKRALSEYNRIWWSQRGKKLRMVEKLRHVTEKLTDDDLNMLVKELTGDILSELTRGNKFSALAKVLMKKPKLIVLARHLL
jgi:digeranylgeranylglycerophospholipid reductase